MRLRFFAAPLAVVVMFLNVPSAAAQKCQAFRAVGQMQLGNTWFGQTFASLDGESIITVPGANPTEITFPPGTSHGVVGKDFQGAKYLYDFGNGDSFVLELKSTAVYPHPPGKIGMGYYRATYNVTEGKGRFTGASGVISESGPYVVWPATTDANHLLGADGRYNAELNGNICYGK